MKITARTKIADWYDTNEFSHLDYPPLAAYVHYLMSYVYRYFNEGEFYNLPLTGYGFFSKQMKEAIRYAVLSQDFVVFYPVIIFMVLYHLSYLRKVQKLGVMLLFMNMPMFAYIEHANTQTNGTHLGLFLLSIHFLLVDWHVLSTMFFALCLTFKHAAAPLVLPVALFMIARTWAYRNSSIRPVYSCIYITK